jgi:hypothetical protein
MGRLKFVFALSVTLVTTIAIAEEKPNAAPIVPPRFVTVWDLDKSNGKIALTTVTVRFVVRAPAKEKEADRELNGPKVKPVYETRVESYEPGVGEVFDTQGKKLTDEDIWKKVKVGAIALVSGDGNKVHPVYLEMIAKETLIFVLPQRVTGPIGSEAAYLPVPLDNGYLPVRR